MNFAVSIVYVKKINMRGYLVNEKISINKIYLLSMGKVIGALHALIGLLLGGIVTIASIIGASASMSITAGAFSFMFGIVSVIMFPILYGIIGFIIGVIAALLYNIATHLFGGLNLELKFERD